MTAPSHKTIADRLVKEVMPLSFAPQVDRVYNPLVYARGAFDAYVKRYGAGPREILFLGMNPGPWGMAQTGVPFGEIAAVRDWLGICTPVGQPENPHPKRPVQGFDCPRSEVSGRRFWGWARNRFDTPRHFFDRFFVINYCPLVFMGDTGRNITPASLPVTRRKPLLAACDTALQATVRLMECRMVLGIGVFAEQRARAALKDLPVTIGRITHPSPANPKANRGWEELVDRELQGLGIL